MRKHDRNRTESQYSSTATRALTECLMMQQAAQRSLDHHPLAPGSALDGRIVADK